ncbi:MAG: 3-oxo-5,6-dehydrosuberyl-CoA semialdehyde dehydrogenase / 2-oxepin-2(3H)-ylideneacetyl-CoA hydrolase, partial [uncultured Solirubrobacteraceae bacterium]
RARRRPRGARVDLRAAGGARLLRPLGRRRAVRRPGAGPGARQLRARQPALREAGLHRRHHPGAARLQEQGGQGRPRGAGAAGRGGVGRRGDQPGPGARGGLHGAHPRAAPRHRRAHRARRRARAGERGARGGHPAGRCREAPARRRAGTGVV